MGYRAPASIATGGVIVFHALSSDGDIELDADLTDAGLNAVVDALC